MKIDIPELCLVLLVGATASGKSTFARKHFLSTEIISSDFCRALLADDENDQTVTKEAFELLHTMVAMRLKLGRLTVVDATNVQPESRKNLIALAREYHVFTVAIVFDLPEKVLLERHATRTDRNFPAHVIRNQRNDLNRSIRGLEQRERVRFVHVLKTPDQVGEVTITRTRLWTNRREEHGPFDIIGDIHGCFDELVELLRQMDYSVEQDADGWRLSHPAGRKAVFVGDLVDRGPNSPAVMTLVQSAAKAGSALCVAGNHDVKLAKALNGRDVKMSHGLERSMEQLASHDAAERKAYADFLDGLISHYVLDDGKLVVAHAGLKENLQGRSSGAVRSFAMYGETTGETDEFGLPVRYNWAMDYRGKAMVVYGHTPVPEAEWLNNTICVDTGCVFGGKLTALRYPERELVSVPAKQEYYAPTRPLVKVDGLSAQQRSDDMLALEDVSGKRYIRTEFGGTVRIKEENAAAALEVMSRFAADPRWLIYLPATISPSETSNLPGLLEHPREAFDYYRKSGVLRVICEEKHMGSRAVVIVCKDSDAAKSRFGVESGAQGIVYTRTGRAFFSDEATESQLIGVLAEGMTRAGLWETLNSDWVCLDCELMPWSAKAIELLKSQYAAVGAAGQASLSAAVPLLQRAAARTPAVETLLAHAKKRQSALSAFKDAYARYCWEVRDLRDIKLAPFHLLASESHVHHDKTHGWHLETIARLAKAVPQLVLETPHKIVDLTSAESEHEATEWWLSLTAQGGEGMVVKPETFVARSAKGLLQPAIKCRGPEYLRIIYGPEYLLPENIERLRSRGLSAKRALALKEFGLGMESLGRFVRREPLRQTHECVFAVLAMESEPIDPRL